MGRDFMIGLLVEVVAMWALPIKMIIPDPMDCSSIPSDAQCWDPYWLHVVAHLILLIEVLPLRDEIEKYHHLFLFSVLRASSITFVF